jgi:uncharacterized membrane protein HdeD (DUF308 family)
MSELSDIARLPARVGTGWGFAVMLLGVLAVMVPFVSGVAVTSFVAVLITAAGLTMTMYAFKAGSFGKGLLQFLFGGITIVCGVAMFVTPMLSMFTLTGVLMVYFVVDGGFSIYSGVKGRPAPGWGWVIISGIASIVLAVLLYREWPDSGTYAVGLLVGIRLIFAGWSIAMLGMLGDVTVDVAKEVVKEAAQQSDNA